LTVFVLAVTEVIPRLVRLSASDAGTSLAQFTGGAIRTGFVAAAVDTPAPTSAAELTTARRKPFARIRFTALQRIGKELAR
jgi:hypothetical protein